MTRTRTGVAAAVLLAALGVTAGCQSKANDQPSGAASPTAATATPANTEADARTVLTGAIAASTAQSFTFTVKTADPSQGSMAAAGSYTPDPKTAGIKFDQGGISIEVRLVDSTSYIKITGIPNVPDQWMKVDLSKIGPNADSSLIKLTGPNDFAKVFNGITAVKDNGDGTFSGTIDMTKAKDSEVMTKDDYAKYGDKAKSVAFTAAVDDQGRLTQVKLTLAPQNTFEITYADWGTATPVSAPPATDVVDAPDYVYAMFNN